MSEQNEPDEPNEPDEFLEAALQEENDLLQQAMQVAQAEHLMRRCVEMNAQARRAAAAEESESKA